MRIVFLMLWLIFFSSSTFSQNTSTYAKEITDAVSKLCSGGQARDYKFEISAKIEAKTNKFTGKILGGNLEGTVSLTENERDGFYEMRQTPELYTECVTKMTPLFINTYKPSKFSTITDSKIQGWSSASSPSLRSANFNNKFEMKQYGCKYAMALAKNKVNRLDYKCDFLEENQCKEANKADLYYFESKIYYRCTKQSN